MAKEILYTVALDSKDQLVHIKDASKGRIYYCPDCKSQFILRKSGKTGKGSKRPHFAHNHVTTNCTPESNLHLAFKRYLTNLLQRHVSESKELKINWTCNACSFDYSRINRNFNLLAKTATIEEEYYLKECRPDIALLDAKRNVIAAIEIVVTHPPSEDTLLYFKRNGITLIQINLDSDEDLEKVEEKITNPDVVNFCLSPKCPNFENHLVLRKFKVGDAKCTGGNHLKRTCVVEADSVFGIIRISDILTEKELVSAQKQGVQFKVHRKRLVIICPTCVENNKRIRARYRRRRF